MYYIKFMKEIFMTKPIFKKAVVAVTLAVTMTVSVFGSSAAATKATVAGGGYSVTPSGPEVYGRLPDVATRTTTAAKTATDVATRTVTATKTATDTATKANPTTTAKATTKPANTEPNTKLSAYAAAELKSLEKISKNPTLQKNFEILQKGVSVKSETNFVPTKELLQLLGLNPTGKINATKILSNAAIKGEDHYQTFDLFNGAEKTLTGKIWTGANGASIVSIPEFTSKYIIEGLNKVVPAANVAAAIKLDTNAFQKTLQAIGTKFIAYTTGVVKKAGVDVKTGGINLKADSYTLTLTERQIREILYYALGQVKLNANLVSILNSNGVAVKDLDAIRAELKTKKLDFVGLKLVSYVSDGEIVARTLSKVQTVNKQNITTAQFNFAAIAEKDGKYAQIITAKSYNSATKKLETELSVSNVGTNKNGSYTGNALLSLYGQQFASLSYADYTQTFVENAGNFANGTFAFTVPSAKLSIKGTVTSDTKAKLSAVKLTGTLDKTLLFTLDTKATLTNDKIVAAPKITAENSINISAKTVSDKDSTELNANTLKWLSKYSKTDANDIIGYYIIKSLNATKVATASVTNTVQKKVTVS
jgi:hypothetical protein